MSEKENTKNDRKASSPDNDALFTDINAESKSYTINIDCNNSINIDLNNNKINVYCDNEDIRNKIKDSLLKCLKTL